MKIWSLNTSLLLEAWCDKKRQSLFVEHKTSTSMKFCTKLPLLVHFYISMCVHIQLLHYTILLFLRLTLSHKPDPPGHSFIQFCAVIVRQLPTHIVPNHFSFSIRYSNHLFVHYTMNEHLYFLCRPGALWLPCRLFVVL